MEWTVFRKNIWLVVGYIMIYLKPDISYYYSERKFFYISLKNSVTPWFRDFVIPWLRDFMNLFWSMTSKVIQGHKQWPFYLKIHLFFCLCYWLIEINAAEHYERTKFDLYKDDIYFNLNLFSYGQLFVLVFRLPVSL